MKNALVYSVNDNELYLTMMQNSINSFFENCPSLKGLVDVYVITDVFKIEFPKIRCGVVPIIMSDLSYDYSSLFNDDRLPVCVYYRWEIFNNEIFQKYDNVLYMDVDVEVEHDISELFLCEHEPGIYTVTENKNKLVEQGINNLNRYDNSGVILTTPRKLGSDFCGLLFSDLISAAKTHKFKLKDQCAMNFVLNMKKYKDKWKHLNCTYNYFSSTKDGITYAKNAKVLHRAGFDCYKKTNILRFI